METDYKKAANITIIAAGLLLFVYLFLKYATGALLPFIIAYLISLAISPGAKRLSSLTRLPKKVSSVILTVFFFAIIALLIYLSLSRLIVELGSIANGFSEDPTPISNAINSLLAELGRFGERFSFIEKLLSSEAIRALGLDLDRLIPEAISSMLSSLTAYLPSAAVNILSMIPDALLFLAVLVISSFYFSADGEGIVTSLSSILPEHWQRRLPAIRQKISSTLTAYVKAYLLIMLLTFCEVFLGLSVMGVKYAFIISIFIALVDILPILGTGTVLVPWMLYSLITADYKSAIGLAVIYGIVSLVRQIAEPKIVGDSIGLHPLATLSSIYISVKLIGFAGFFIGPVIALLIRNLFFGGRDKEGEDKSRKREKPHKADHIL